VKNKLEDDYHVKVTYIKFGRDDKLLLNKFMGLGRKVFKYCSILSLSWRGDVPEVEEEEKDKESWSIIEIDCEEVDNKKLFRKFLWH
jgi:hypothetical protein